MEAARLLHSNSSSSLRRPQLVALMVDEWNPSWKDFHFGYGSVGGICSQTAGSRSVCFGVRLVFDGPIVIDGPSEARRWRGFPSGLELGDSTGTQWQPMTLLDVRTDNSSVVQLNVTFAPFGKANGSLLLTSPEPAAIRYAWHDYPDMQLYSAESGRPVAPFGVWLNNGSVWGAPHGGLHS